ncbi:HD domain-containing protein, partial [Nanoarchaeota archaeon]
LSKQIPTGVSEEFLKYWEEYEEGKTKEAQFARAISDIEGFIHFFSKRKDWKGFGLTEQEVRERKEKNLKPFPAIHKAFNDILKHLAENNLL